MRTKIHFDSRDIVVFDQISTIQRLLLNRVDTESFQQCESSCHDC